MPGSQFTYSFDQIGNRLVVEQGDSNNMYPSKYERNPLNQYESRCVPGYVEVTGPAAMALIDDGNGAEQATRFFNSSSELMYDGFFHSRMSFDNGAGPLRASIAVEEVYGDFTNFDVFIPPVGAQRVAVSCACSSRHSLASILSQMRGRASVAASFTRPAFA